MPAVERQDVNEFELSDRPTKKLKISKKSKNVSSRKSKGQSTHATTVDTSINSKLTRQGDQNGESKPLKTHDDDDSKIFSNGHLEVDDFERDSDDSKAVDDLVSQAGLNAIWDLSGDESVEEAESQKTERHSRKANTKQGPKITKSDDMALHSTADNITKTTSRIKPRSRSAQLPKHHLEVTEISNSKVVDAKSSFATIDVAPWLIASLAAMEIRRPTAIQKSCIPEILKGRDVIGGSKTGSGKTVTFAVPIIQKWAEDPMGVYALILTPTRELALQIYEQFNAISAPQSMKTILVTGGTEMRPQAIALASRPHIVIATPGRLADHINTSGVDTIVGLRRTRVVVLDEADRLLAPGPGSMLLDVETCLGILPPSSARQTCLFTATLTTEVMALKDMPRQGVPPIYVCEIDSESDLAIPDTLHQTYLLVPPVMKEAYLHILLLTPDNLARKSIIVFCNRTRTADLLERLLRGLDHSVTSLHSKLPQYDRNSNLSRFRARASRILIASDVASRGLDIPEVDLVINYDVPRNPDDYIHRVGRTARAGRKGDSVTMVDRRDLELIFAIEARVGQKMKEYEEEGVNVQTRVVRDALRLVGEKKREVIIGIEEGRDVRGNRTRGKIRRLE